MQITIYIFPAHIEMNKYLELQFSILRRICADVRPLPPIRDWVRLSNRRKATIVLNWYEDQLCWQQDYSFKAIGRHILSIIMMRILFGRIIWVRHNLWPHDLQRNVWSQWIILNIMRIISSKIVTHRLVIGCPSQYIPHPLYFEGTVSKKERDIEYLYFGVIKKYKGLNKVLRHWPPDRRLVIAGSAPDQQLLENLQQCSQDRQLNVEFQIGFLKEEELSALLSRTRFVILPHIGSSVIVSGALFHAASYGANILVRDGDFGQAMTQLFSFVHCFDPPALSDLLTNVSYREPANVIEEVRKSNGTEACVAAWRSVLG